MSSFLKVSIPKDWKVKKLKDCTNINPENLNLNGLHEDDLINYIDISSIDKSTYQIKEVKEIPISDIPSRARRIIKENDVIISTVRPYLKAFSKINREHNNFVCSTGFAVLRAKEELNYEYLFQWVLNQKFVNYMISQMVGSSYPAVNMSDVEVAPIILPPLNEQLRIGSILSNIDYLIVKTQKIIENLQILKKGLMQRLFTKGIGHTEFKETKVGRIPKSWNVLQLKKIGKIFTGKTPSTKIDDYWGDDVPFITPADISNNHYIRKTERFVSYLGAKQSKTIPKNGICTVCIGSTVGKVALAVEDSITNQQINSLICDENIDPHYICYAISKRSSYLKTYAGVAAVPIVKKSLFESFRIPVPSSIEEQKLISKILLSVDNNIEIEEKFKNKLKEIKKGLMHDLLTGKKRVNLE